MESQTRIKYYKIRASVLWLVLILIITVLGMLVLMGNYIRQEETFYAEYGRIVSELENIENCYLCGNADDSLMGYYRKFDTIGIIGLNEWNILDLRLKEYDSEGNLVEDYKGSTSLNGNNQGVAYQISSIPARGMAKASISSEDGMFDETLVKEHLCQECLDKVTDTLEGYFAKGKEEYLPFCIVDFETLEVHPVQRMNLGYFVRDYWVNLNFEDTIELQVYYLPDKSQ